MYTKDASGILCDQEDDADSSTDVDSSDELTLVYHESLQLPEPSKFEGRPQWQRPLYPTPTRQGSHQSIYARNIQATAPSNSNPTPVSTPSQHSSPSGSPWLPSAYPRSHAEPDYRILPDDLSSQNTALFPPPWHRSRQGGKASYEPCQKPLYSTLTRQRPLLAKLQTHKARPDPNPNASFESIYARNVQPTVPSNPNTTPRPAPSTYTPHPSQRSSPPGSPCMPSAYPRGSPEPHYHILPDDLSSQITALSPPPWHRSRQGGKVAYEPVDHTHCPIHRSTQPCWSCERAHNSYANEELRFPF